MAMPSDQPIDASITGRIFVLFETKSVGGPDSMKDRPPPFLVLRCPDQSSLSLPLLILTTSCPSIFFPLCFFLIRVVYLPGAPSLLLPLNPNKEARWWISFFVPLPRAGKATSRSARYRRVCYSTRPISRLRCGIAVEGSSFASTKTG